MSAADRPDGPQLFVAGCLMAAGGLVAGLCGLCTAGFAVWPLVDSVMAGKGFGALPDSVYFGSVFLVGGLPTLAGLALFIPGLMMWRRAKRK